MLIDSPHGCIVVEQLLSKNGNQHQQVNWFPDEAKDATNHGNDPKFGFHAIVFGKRSVVDKQQFTTVYRMRKQLDQCFSGAGSQYRIMEMGIGSRIGKS